MLKPGDNAPDFKLFNQHGDFVPLSDFCGEHVVVYFHPCTDAPDCTTETCGPRDSWDEFKDRDVTVLGISNDPVSDPDSLAKKYDLPSMLLSDKDGSVSAAYDPYGEKNAFGKVFDNVFYSPYPVGPDGTVERVYEGVSSDGHADEILANLDGWTGGRPLRVPSRRTDSYRPSAFFTGDG